MNSREILNVLRRYESRNVTYIDPDGSWPILWDRAKGVHVWDADGRRYLDLTAAFGVAAAGHANASVVRAGQRQMRHLLHAMGDVHPHALKARLARELSRITFERWSSEEPRRTEGKGRRLAKRNPKRAVSAKTIFCNSGFEAVEAALKTAKLATDKPGVIVFEGAYHGLGYGALSATHRDHFRGPFRSQLGGFGHFVPFPKQSVGLSNRARLKRDRSDSETRDSRAIRDLGAALGRLFQKKKFGAILVEPIQVRGGVNIPPPGFLPLLRRICDEHGALLILDEIYTGFGRTGRWFACEHSGVMPDVVCLGKALTGGFPLSACVGRAEVMDRAWPESSGEAIHTSTFLGHPVGCAMALAQISEIRRLKLVERSEQLGKHLLQLLQSQISDLGFGIQARGMGLLAGLELQLPGGAPATAESLRAVKAMLRRGCILLPEGEHANVISFTPPLIITKAELTRTVKALAEVLNEIGV